MSKTLKQWLETVWRPLALLGGALFIGNPTCQWQCQRFTHGCPSLQRSTLQTSTWGAPAWLSAFWIQQGNVRASAYFFVFSPLPHPCPSLCPITPDFFSTWSYPVSCDCGDLGSKTPLKTFRHFPFSFFTSFLLVLCCLWLLVLPCYRK